MKYLSNSIVCYPVVSRVGAKWCILSSVFCKGITTEKGVTIIHAFSELMDKEWHFKSTPEGVGSAEDHI